MKLMSLDYEKNWTPLDLILDSGIKINSPAHLDGGGLRYKNDIINAIRNSGKEKYDRGFEWCAGFGVIGFEVLGLGLCDHMVFSDYYDVAIKDCYSTAHNNNLSNKITGYVSPAIEYIPEEEIWDLVVANPPWAFDEVATSRDYPDPNMLRILVDQDFAIHREFYKNINAHLTDDADLYIIEVNKDPKLIMLAGMHGLNLISIYNTKNAPNGGVFHFKPRR